MRIAIVLGKWLKDDGTISDILKKRLELVRELIDNKNVDKVILSGGMANVNAKVPEALMMYNYLIDKGYSKEMFILEDKSLTTGQNASFSLPKALEFPVKEIIIVSTCEHFKLYNIIKIFEDALERIGINKQVRIMCYTNTLEE